MMSLWQNFYKTLFPEEYKLNVQYGACGHDMPYMEYKGNYTSFIPRENLQKGIRAFSVIYL